jgi:tryptophan synthase beta subunit
MDQEDRIIVAGYGTGTARVGAYARYLNDIGSGITSLEPTTLQLFPQPASDHLNMLTSGVTNGAGTVSLYNVAGRLVHSERVSLGTASLRIDLPAHLAQGSYALELRTPSGVLRSKMLVVRP